MRNAKCKYHWARAHDGDLDELDGLDGVRNPTHVVLGSGQARTEYLELSDLAARKLRRRTASWPVCPYGGQFTPRVVLSSSGLRGEAYWVCSECRLK